MTEYLLWYGTLVALSLITGDVISRFPHVHTFFEAKMDAEQRYAIKYLIRKKKTRQETLCEIKEVYWLAALQKRRFKSCTSNFPKAIIPQLICLEPDLMER